MMTQYKSKVDIVYEGLMEGIAEGAYQQGDRLVISQISKQWQVSDIPVREAVRRLESEGYVRIVANQGAVVCEPDLSSGDVPPPAESGIISHDLRPVEEMGHHKNSVCGGPGQHGGIASGA